MKKFILFLIIFMVVVGAGIGLYFLGYFDNMFSSCGRYLMGDTWYSDSSSGIERIDFLKDSRYQIVTNKDKIYEKSWTCDNNNELVMSFSLNAFVYMGNKLEQYRHSDLGTVWTSYLHLNVEKIDDDEMVLTAFEICTYSPEDPNNPASHHVTNCEKLEEQIRWRFQQ